jgi:hypothetical protein
MKLPLDIILRFNDVPVTADELAFAALEFVGLPYQETCNVAVWRDDLAKWEGAANCFGVLLLAARNMNLLHPFLANHLDLPPALFGQPTAKTLLKILELNFDRVDTLQTSNVMLWRYHDIDPRLTEPHHVGMVVTEKPLQLLHASQQARRTYVCGIDALFRDRIESIWRLKGLPAK